jgi:hypothetical protein
MFRVSYQQCRDFCKIFQGTTATNDGYADQPMLKSSMTITTP